MMHGREMSSNERMFSNLQNASNETSASEMTLYIRENKGVLCDGLRTSSQPVAQ